jgi:hypothetical protein
LGLILLRRFAHGGTFQKSEEMKKIAIFRETNACG